MLDFLRQSHQSDLFCIYDRKGELELTYLFYLFIYLFYFSFSIRDKTGEALKLLLSQGFDPNVQDSEKRISPLHLAVHSSNEMAVRILTQYAACDVNLQVCVIGVASLESLNCAGIVMPILFIFERFLTCKQCSNIRFL